MKPAYYQNQHGGRDRWMVSYLDVLTILLILFVAMAAQTAPNSQKKPSAGARNRTSNPYFAAVPFVPGPSAALAAIKQDLRKKATWMSSSIPAGKSSVFHRLCSFNPAKTRLMPTRWKP